MKLKLVVLSLALFGSLLSAQEVPTISPVPSSTCWMYQPEVPATLSLSEEQCGRISLVWSAVQPQLDELYRELAPIDTDATNLQWVTPKTYEEIEVVLQRTTDVHRKRFAVRAKIKSITDERDRKSLDVLNAKQRLLLAEIDKQALLVKLFGIFANTGLTNGYNNPIFTGNPAKGSAEGRARQ
jgi:hypothetical protein